MIIFKKRAEKKRLLIEKLEKECEEKNLAEQWTEGASAKNRYKIYKKIWMVSFKSSSWDDGPYGWAIRRDVWADGQEKCKLTDLRCGWSSDCRTCVEPIMKHIITIK